MNVVDLVGPSTSLPPLFVAVFILSIAESSYFVNTLRFAALMAHQALRKPVLNKTRVAMRAANLLSTSPAKRDRRVSTPVNKQ